MKKFLCLIALLFASAGLVGCVVPGVTPGGATGKTTITFWHAMGQTNQVIIQEMIDSFEKAYPMFEVEQYSQGGYTDLRDKILNSIPVGEAPTIAQAYPDHIANYLNAKAAQELDSYIDNTKALSDYANLHADFATYTEQVGYTAADKADFVDAFYAEGAVYDTAKTMYCVPFNKSTEVLFYNLDFFKAHAADLAKYGVAADGSWTKPTWEQVEGIAQYYLTSEEYNALDAELKATAAGFSADSEANLFITLTQQWGGAYTSIAANGKGSYDFNNAKSKEAISWFYNNYKNNLFGTSTKFGTDYSSDAFKAMQCIMTIGSSAGASYNTTSNFKTGVAEYPQRADGTNKQVIQQGTNICLFKNDNDLEELGGWLFMKWMTNFDNALLWCTETAYFPIRESVYNSTEFQGKVSDGSTASQAQKVGWSQQQYFYTSVAFMGSSNARDEVEALVQAVLVGTTIDEAYSTAIKNCNKLV